MRHPDTPELYRQLVEALSDYAILVLDVQGRVVSWNAGAQRIKGYTAGEILGRSFELFYPQEAVAAKFPRYELEMAERDGRYEDEGWRVRKDGSRFWANVIITPLREPDGRLKGFAKITRDLSARREAEAQGVRLAAERAGHAEAARRAAELEALNERLQTALREAGTARDVAERATQARDEVLAIVAHDLRNPMQTILAAAAIVRLTDDRDARTRQLASIERSIQQMEHLIGDLLDVARLESGTLSIRRQPVDLHALADRALELFEPQAVARDVELLREVPDDVPSIAADRDRLSQVLSNLLSNALKFTPPGRGVALRATRLEDAVRISVEDAGPGIAQEDLPHVFDRFWQSRRANRAGAGLGLAICKGIVEAHGGRIWAASTQGGGATIQFTLPLTPVTAEADAGGQPQRSGRPSTTS